MKIRLRPFEAPDFETLWAIDQECFPPEIAYSKQELSTYMKVRGSFTLVAECAAECAAEFAGELVAQYAAHSEAGELNGKGIARSGILGFIVGQGSPRRLGHIVTIDVVAEARRFGVGSQMLAAAEGILMERHCRAVKLETAVNNQAAAAFYKKHGYAVRRTIAKYYANGLDAWVMRKNFPSRMETAVAGSKKASEESFGES